MSQTASVLERFIRVHGSGPFFIDDFCALTGCTPEKAQPLLRKAENSTKRVISLPGGIYLLKPSMPSAQARPWNDWSFNVSIQKTIFELCATPMQKSELLQATRLKLTTLNRYLRAMEKSGNLTSSRSGNLKAYQAATFRPLTTYKQELKPQRSK